MPDDISATGWLIVLCFLALGFGIIKFLIVTTNEKNSADASSNAVGSAPTVTDVKIPSYPTADELPDEASPASREGRTQQDGKPTHIE